MSDLVESLKWMVARMIGRGTGRVESDAGGAQVVQVQMNDREVRDKTPRLAEYGFQSNPPDGFDALVVFLGGVRSSGVVVATGHQQYRIKSLQTGEVCISDNQGQKVYLSQSGIRIDGAGHNINIINAPQVIVTGGDVIADGISLKNHHHGGVQSGGSNTGVPV